MWVENPFLINAQIAQLVRVFVFENCVHNETPTNWQRRQKTGAKAGKKGPESIDLFPLQIQLQILPTEGSETELDPYSITVFKRHSLPCPCVQSFIINNKPETKDSQTHSHAQSSRQRKVMAKQLLHMDIQYLLRIRRVVLWRPAVTLFEINARKYTLHQYIYSTCRRETERERERVRTR